MPNELIHIRRPKSREDLIAEQQDKVDQAIWAMLEEIAGPAMPWDITLIGDIRDFALSELEKHFGLTPNDIYPSFEDDANAV